MAHLSAMFHSFPQWMRENKPTMDFVSVHICEDWFIVIARIFRRGRGCEFQRIRQFGVGTFRLDYFLKGLDDVSPL